MIEFQVSTKHTGQKRVIKVMIYETIEQLRRACRKRDGFYGVVQEPAWYEQMAATTNCIQAVQVDGDSDPAEDDWRTYITMRLSRDHMNGATEIIAHEATHAAIYLFNHDVKNTLDELPDQETLCYLVGDITRKVVNKLYERRVLS